MPVIARGEGSGPLVQRIGPAGFTVEGAVYPAVLLTPERALPWSPPPIDALDEAALRPVLDIEPEFVLLGTGATHAFPPRSLIAALDARGIGIEAMDSRAAARAWALLRAEGRWIAAALMPVG